MDPAILVTGGAGYIGSHVCKALAGAGYRPVAYDNLSRGHRWAVRWGPLVVADLADRGALRSTFEAHRIAAVIHLAGLAYVGESMADPAPYFQHNVAQALALLEAMRAAGIDRIVFSSTCATYGVPDALPIDEAQPQRPINPYGESKLFFERVLAWNGQAYGLRWVVLRYFNAAGADPEGEIGEVHDPEPHLIPSVIDAALGRRPPVTVYGVDHPTADGTAVRDYVHVADLAAGHVKALGHLAAGGPSRAYNLGTGRGHSVREVIGRVERIAGLPVPVQVAGHRPGDPPTLIADARRAGAELGWRPELSDLDTIVTTAWRWHRARLPVPPTCVDASAPRSEPDKRRSATG